MLEMLVDDQKPAAKFDFSCRLVRRPARPARIDFDRYRPLSRLLLPCPFDRKAESCHRRVYFGMLRCLRKDIDWTLDRYKRAMAETDQWDIRKFVIVLAKSRMYLAKLRFLGIQRAVGVPISSGAIREILARMEEAVRPAGSALAVSHP